MLSNLFLPDHEIERINILSDVRNHYNRIDLLYGNSPLQSTYSKKSSTQLFHFTGTDAEHISIRVGHTAYSAGDVISIMGQHFDIVKKKDYSKGMWDKSYFYDFDEKRMFLHERPAGEGKNRSLVLKIATADWQYKEKAYKAVRQLSEPAHHSLIEINTNTFPNRPIVYGEGHTLSPEYDLTALIFAVRFGRNPWQQVCNIFPYCLEDRKFQLTTDDMINGRITGYPQRGTAAGQTPPRISLRHYLKAFRYPSPLWFVRCETTFRGKATIAKYVAPFCPSGSFDSEGLLTRSLDARKVRHRHEYVSLMSEERLNGTLFKKEFCGLARELYGKKLNYGMLNREGLPDMHFPSAWRSLMSFAKHVEREYFNRTGGPTTRLSSKVKGLLPAVVKTPQEAVAIFFS